MTGNLHSNRVFFSLQHSAVMNAMFFYFSTFYFFFHVIYLRYITGGNLWCWFHSVWHTQYIHGLVVDVEVVESKKKHREGKMGQKCTSFQNPYTCSPHKNSAVFKTGCNKEWNGTMWGPSQRRLEEGAFVDHHLLPNFFHCCIKLTVDLVCVWQAA